jgi:hypothetical protein
MPAEGGAEPAAEQREVGAGGLRTHDVPGAEGVAGHPQRLAQSLMSGGQLTVPGDQPVLFALTHGGSGKGSS